MYNKELKGSLFIIFAAFLWGTTGTTQGLAPAEANSAVIGTLRILIGGFVLFIIALAKNKKISFSKIPISTTLLGVFAVALYQISFFYGVKLAGVAIGTVVGIGSSPISAGLLSAIFLKEKLHRKWMISTFISIIGLFFISFSSKQVNYNFNIFGVFLAITAGFSYALYTMISKKLLEVLDNDTVMAILFLGGAVFLSPVLFFNDLSWVLTTRGLLVTLHLGLFTTALSYIFFIRGLNYIAVSKTATLSLTEPLTAAFLGITILNEKPNIYSIIGIILIFIGIMILTFNLQKNK